MATYRGLPLPEIGGISGKWTAVRMEFRPRWPQGMDGIHARGRRSGHRREQRPTVSHGANFFGLNTCVTQPTRNELCR